MKIIWLWVCIVCVICSSVSFAKEPEAKQVAQFKLTDPVEIKKADLFKDKFAKLLEATDDVRGFAEKVARRCAQEGHWQDVGFKPEFNPACGKAFGRLANAPTPDNRQQCMTFISCCKGAYAVRKALMKNSKMNVTIRYKNLAYSAYETGATTWTDRDEVEKYAVWLNAYEAFVKTRCDVSDTKHFRYVMGNYTYDGAKNAGGDSETDAMVLTTDVSPAAFKTELMTKKCTFKARARIYPSMYFPMEIRNKRTDYFGVSLTLYHATKDTCEHMYAIVPRTSEMGKKIYELLVDGEYQNCIVTVHCGKYKNYSEYLTIDKFKEVDNSIDISDDISEVLNSTPVMRNGKQRLFRTRSSGDSASSDDDE